MSELYPANRQGLVPPLGAGKLADATGAESPSDRTVLQTDDTISLLDLLAVLLRHKRLIVVMTALVGSLLLGYVGLTVVLPVGHPLNMLPNVYRPTAEILLSPAKQSSSSLSSLVSGSDLGALAGLLGRGFSGNTNADLVVKLLKGATLRDKIAQELDFVGHYRITANPKSATRAVFDSAVKTQYDAASSVLTISYTDTDREFATTALNTLILALEERFTGLTAQRLEESRALVKQQLGETETDLRTAQKSLVDYSRAHGIVDINAQKTSYVDANAGFRQQLANKELKLAELNAYLPPSDPQVRMLQNEIEVLRRFIGETTGGFSKFSPLSIPESEVPQVAAEYLNLQYDVQLRQSIYLATRQNWESILLQQKGSVPEFQILERAQVPEMKSGPSRRRIVVIGTFAGLFLSILAAFVVEYFRRASVDPVESWKLIQIGQLIRGREH